jgi:hypothetical protein
MKSIKNVRCFLSVIVLLSAMSLGGVCLAGEDRTNDPAQDPTYLRLKDKDVNMMTDREYELFKQKESAVAQYRTQRSAMNSMEKTTNRSMIFWVLIAAVPLIIVLAM